MMNFGYVGVSISKGIVYHMSMETLKFKTNLNMSSAFSKGGLEFENSFQNIAWRLLFVCHNLTSFYIRYSFLVWPLKKNRS